MLKTGTGGGAVGGARGEGVAGVGWEGSSAGRDERRFFFFFAGRDERRCGEGKAERKERDTEEAGAGVELWEELRDQEGRARLEFLVGWQRQRKKMR